MNCLTSERKNNFVNFRWSVGKYNRKAIHLAVVDSTHLFIVLSQQKRMNFANTIVYFASSR